MEPVRIILSASWVSLMLTYLFGDTLRIFAGDFEPGKILGTVPTQGLYLGITIFLTIPIVMVFLSLTLSYPAVRWVSIVAPIFLFVFNLIGLPGYPGAYDKFLIIVGLVFNALTVWYAWKWVA
ncbi:MAG: hypothetical protein GTO18_00060 [Anaerolineales bacterium]|nr:hypothetical protein [Anaerolineales bacterium]